MTNKNYSWDRKKKDEYEKWQRTRARLIAQHIEGKSELNLPMESMILEALNMLETLQDISYEYKISYNPDLGIESCYITSIEGLLHNFPDEESYIDFSNDIIDMNTSLSQLTMILDRDVHKGRDELSLLLSEIIFKYAMKGWLVPYDGITNEGKFVIKDDEVKYVPRI